MVLLPDLRSPDAEAALGGHSDFIITLCDYSFGTGDGSQPGLDIAVERDRQV